MVLQAKSNRYDFKSKGSPFLALQASVQCSTVLALQARVQRVRRYTQSFKRYDVTSKCLTDMAL